jgi:predicted nucleotide-binding protein
MEHLLNDARYVGFLKVVKGGAEWVELNGASTDLLSNSHELEEASQEVELEIPDSNPSPIQSSSGNGTTTPTTRPNKVFIAHGRNRGPLEQLKKMLDRFKVPYAVAVDEPHAGRPISTKVANLMHDCSAGIFIFTADELFFREGKDGNMQEIYRPSENVVYELGAASILYGQKIVIFKEENVTFPSDFSDLGHISFKSDQLDDRLGDLLHELVGLDLLEVRVKA